VSYPAVNAFGYGRLFKALDQPANISWQISWQISR
jgi:hypothetical protein